MNAEWNVHRSGRGRQRGLLLLHGLMGSGADWAGISDLLPGDYAAAAPDLPGHGRTPVDAAGVGMDTLSKRLMEVAAGEFGGPCAIAGYSLGGRIALHAAIRFPGRFTGLVVVSSTAGIEDARERAGRTAADREKARLLRESGVERLLETWYDQPVFASLSPEQVEELRKRRAENDAESVAVVLESLSQGRQPVLWPHLHRLDVPALVIAGERDGKYAALAHRMAAGMPRARVEIIPGAGHIPQMENRPAFVNALNSFLEGLENRAN